MCTVLQNTKLIVDAFCSAINKSITKCERDFYKNKSKQMEVDEEHTQLISRKLCSFLLMFSSGFTSLSFLLLFLLSITFFCLCAWFLILFHQHIGWSKKAPYFVFHPKVAFYNFFSMFLRWCTQQACEILLTPIWIQMNDLLCSSS